jgi:hypothetical protein
MSEYLYKDLMNDYVRVLVDSNVLGHCVQVSPSADEQPAAAACKPSLYPKMVMRVPYSGRCGLRAM